MIHYSQLLIDFRTNGHSVILRQITQPELEFFTQQLQISVAHLPKLHVNDPQVMFYGYERG